MSEFTLTPMDFTLKKSQGVNDILDQSIQNLTSIDAILAEQEARARATQTKTIRGVQDATDLDSAADRVSDQTNGGHNSENRGTPTTTNLSAPKAKTPEAVDVPTSISKERAVDVPTSEEAPTKTSEIGALESMANTVANFATELAAPTSLMDVAAMALGPVGIVAKATYDTAVSEETPVTDLMARVTKEIDDALNADIGIGYSMADMMGISEATKHDDAEEGTGLGGGGRSSSHDASKGSTRGHSNADNDASHGRDNDSAGSQSDAGMGDASSGDAGADGNSNN